MWHYHKAVTERTFTIISHFRLHNNPLRRTPYFCRGGAKAPRLMIGPKPRTLSVANFHPNPRF